MKGIFTMNISGPSSHLPRTLYRTNEKGPNTLHRANCPPHRSTAQQPVYNQIIGRYPVPINRCSPIDLSPRNTYHTSYKTYQTSYQTIHYRFGPRIAQAYTFKNT